VTPKPDDVGAVACAFIGEEVDAESDRKSSLESRAIAVITSSGTLVTLLLGLAALVTKSSTFVLDRPERWLLSASALLFVVSAALGIVASAPFRYLLVDPKSLTSTVAPNVWSEDGSVLHRELTTVRLAQLEDARTHNESRAEMLVAALAVQVLAVLLTAATVAVVLLG
jgi:hypothetical protein